MEREETFILLGEGVFRLSQHAYKVVLGQLVDIGQHRQTSNKLWDQAVLDHVVRLHLIERRQFAVFLYRCHSRFKTDTLSI